MTLAVDEAPIAPTCKNQSAKCLYEQDSYRVSSLTYGCKKQEKSANGITYSVCRKNGKMVSASEYSPEADAGLAYWFDQGKVIAIRYYGDSTLVMLKGAKVRAVYNVYDEGKTSQPTVEQRKQFESTAATGYKSIFRRFGIR
jgi:hypothetical protein